MQVQSYMHGANVPGKIPISSYAYSKCALLAVCLESKAVVQESNPELP